MIFGFTALPQPNFLTPMDIYVMFVNTGYGIISNVSCTHNKDKTNRAETADIQADGGLNSA